MRKPSRIVQAAVIVSLILISSAIFLSQADRIAGKAQATKITGTMVLLDQPTNIRDSMDYKVYLPTTACTGNANVCYGTDTSNTNCKSMPLSKVSGYLYAVPIGEVLATQSVSCGTNTISFNNVAIATGGKFAYLSLAGYEWCLQTVSGTISLTSPPATLSMGYAGYTCVGGRSTSTVVDASSYTSLTGSITVACTGGATDMTGTVIVQRKLPYPVFHISVSYECT